ncbi:uncharacterized protein LOC123564422 [Mercenaria mercenaria]|uniref:uncharacterized protein LOC123564422 n=1 Tax=Mercenaria mercenaria TaxID=6596 RepID=UPI00234E767C|nr:uncharacterized protein LOC123564422 [Mercenaria mercenaria]
MCQAVGRALAFGEIYFFVTKNTFQLIYCLLPNIKLLISKNFTDSKEALDRYATKAHKALSDLKEKPSTPPEILFDLVQASSKSGDGKRDRKKTKRLEESNIQEQEFSPRKKKRVESPVESKEKENEDINRQVSQSPTGKLAEKEKGKTKATESKKDAKEQDPIQASVEQILPSQPQNHTHLMSDILNQFSAQDTSTSTETATGNEDWPCTQATSYTELLGEKQSPIKLTETWQLCRDADRQIQFQATVPDIQPALDLTPSEDFMTFLRLMVKPEVQQYAKMMLEHFSNLNSTTTNSDVQNSTTTHSDVQNSTTTLNDVQNSTTTLSDVWSPNVNRLNSFTQSYNYSQSMSTYTGNHDQSYQIESQPIDHSTPSHLEQLCVQPKPVTMERRTSPRKRPVKTLFGENLQLYAASWWLSTTVTAVSLNLRVE